VQTETLLRCRQKGFFVSRRQPTANARIVRRRPRHRPGSTVALLAWVGLCAAQTEAQGEAPIYETVVSAAPSAPETAREDSAASSSVITKERIPRAAESVTELLSEQSGTTVTRLGGMGATATISLRGSTSNQVSVYLDGVPLNSATGGGVDLGSLPLADVERIEIYRGMSPIAFGASAIGGVVSITTAVPTANSAEVSLGGGSFGTYYGDGRGTYKRGRVSVYGGVHAFRTEGDFPYVNNDNTTLTAGDDQAQRRHNNDSQQIDGMLRSVVDLSNGRRLSASVLLFGRDQGLPGPGSLGSPTARLGTFRGTGILAYESAAAFGPGGRLRATLYGNYDLTHFDNPDRQLGINAADARDRTYTAGGTTAWRWATTPWLSLSGIADLRYDRFRPSDAGMTGLPGTRLFGALGLESDFWIRALGLDAIPSARLEVAREETSGRDDFSKFLPTSPATSHALPIVRLALVKELTGWLNLRANGGRYARLPSLVELYGNTGYLVGNARLRPESGLNIDVGPQASWKSGSNRVLWTTAAFASLVDDLIQYQIGNGHARPDNTGSARILGVETEGTFEFGSHLRAVIAATFTDARDTSADESNNGKQLPFRPRYRLYARPEWRALHITARTALGLYVDCDATAGNYLDAPNLVRAPARMLFGAGAYADLPGGFQLRASARNLGDSAVHDISNYPLPGREIYVTLAWSAHGNPQNKE
jgi:outer membrane cobalamin receptor